MSRGFYDIMEAALSCLILFIGMVIVLGLAVCMGWFSYWLAAKIRLRIQREERLCPQCHKEKELLRPCKDCGELIGRNQVDCKKMVSFDGNKMERMH